MKRRNLKKSVWNITPAKRALILRVLESIENRQPKTVYSIDLFHSGITINSRDVTLKVVRFLKEII